MQKFAADALAQMMGWCQANKKVKVVSHILKNMASLLFEHNDGATLTEGDDADDDEDVAAMQNADRSVTACPTPIGSTPWH